MLTFVGSTVKTSDTTLVVVQSQRLSIPSRMLHESFGMSLQLLFMFTNEEQDDELTRQQSTHVGGKNTTAQFGLRVFRMAGSHKTPKLY